MSEQHAIIDIGSNTLRLVVYNGPSRSPVVLLNEKVTAKLGRTVARNGLLSEKSMATALAALARYRQLLKLMSVADVEVVATAAVRDAANGEEFLKAVRKIGLAPKLLSGEEEARISALGVIAAFPDARGVAGDLGGGSLELTTIDGSDCGKGVTLPFGTLALAEMRAEGPAKFARRVRKALRAAEWTEGAGQPFFLVGGSWRALARYALNQSTGPLDDPHGFEMTPEAALRLCRRVATGKLDSNVEGISVSRQAGLPDAAAMLAVLIREIKPSRLVFSSWGLREGLLYRKLDKGTRGQDPLLAGVAGFVEGYGVSASTATMLAGWTADAVSLSRGEDERLRLAATMLALASMRSEPNLRSGLARDWALRKRWHGIDVRGRAMLAVAALANAGRTVVPADLVGLASDQDFADAVSWGLAIRLCRRFTAGAAQALSSTSLRRDGGRLVLALHGPFHALYTEVAAKDLKALADWQGLEASVELL